MNKVDQARQWVESKAEPAISGSGGHDRAFNVACVLVNGFDLSPFEAFPLMSVYSTRCSPPWTEGEIKHKLNDAERAKHSKPRGFMLRPGTDGRQSKPETVGRRLTKNRSRNDTRPAPIAPDPAATLPKPIPDGARALLRGVFREGEGVRLAVGTPDNARGPKRDRVSGDCPCLALESWLQRLDAVNGDPQKVHGLRSRGGAGVYIGVNPMKEGGSRDSDVISFRHCLVEYDDLTLPEQWSIYSKSDLPIAALIHSGGKSLHAWVKIEAQDRKEYEERVSFLYDHLTGLGFSPDRKNKNPGRLSRLPNCKRFDSRQELLALDIGAPSWSAWFKKVQDEDLQTKRPSEYLAIDAGDLPTGLLGERGRWLYRGGSLLLIGQSGLGKSSLVVQLALLWAMGRPVFGIAPRGPLRSLIVQAENDQGDVSDMVKGIVQGNDLNPFDPAFIEADERVEFAHELSLTGPEFCEKLQRRIDKSRPDLVWLDPILSFVGADISEQEVIGDFFRTQLNAIAHGSGVAIICVHHTGKPSRDPKKRWQNDGDLSYLGFGSSDLTNWARGAAILQAIPDEDNLFELRLGKRGNYAGATNPETGLPTKRIFLKHSRVGICWEQIAPDFEPMEPDRPTEKPTKPKLLVKADLSAAWKAWPDKGLSQNKAADLLHSKVGVLMDISEGSCKTAVKLMAAMKPPMLELVNGLFVPAQAFRQPLTD